MALFDYDLGVIGGGSAGLTTAAGAARLGVKTVLIEREPALGGDCLHYGCVPSKTLIRSANVYHLMRRAPEFGLPVQDIAPVDFRLIVERIRRVIAEIQHHDSPERFCGLGVRIVFGQARFRGPHSVEVDGRVISAARWVIATGSTAALPPIPGLAEARPLTNREIFYLDRLPESLLILGGGAEAVEMAQAFVRLGSRVTLVQRSPHILSKEDPDLADMLAARLREEGVIIHAGTRIEAVRRENGLARADLIRGEERFTATGHEMLVAMGRAQVLDDLDVDRIGLARTDKGLVLDSRLRTSRAHIYAAGDATGAHLYTHAAAYEAGVVIANAVFRLPRKADYSLMPRCVYTSPEYACVGLNEKWAKELGLSCTVHMEEFRTNDRSLAEGEGMGLLKLLLGPRDTPIGVQILGARAGDLLGEWIAAMSGKVGLPVLAGAVHPYPTYSELTKAAAGAVVGKKLFSEKVRKGLKLFFSYNGRACGLPGDDAGA